MTKPRINAKRIGARLRRDGAQLELQFFDARGGQTTIAIERPDLHALIEHLLGFYRSAGSNQNLHAQTGGDATEFADAPEFLTVTEVVGVQSHAAGPVARLRCSPGREIDLSLRPEAGLLLADLLRAQSILPPMH